MSILFIEENPTSRLVERLRLLLSTYQDGSGMLVLKDGTNLPGWRDFERAVASAFAGQAQENKAVFDVLIASTDQQDRSVTYGLSCKMRGTLNDTRRSGRVTIELSNSASKFWTHLQTTKNITHTNWKQNASEVGAGLIELVETWHHNESRLKAVEIARSSYLVLSWQVPSSGRGKQADQIHPAMYQLHRFPMDLPDPATLQWSFPTKRSGQATVEAGRLVGRDAQGTVFEWYGESGGQLKYYPAVTAATWQSDEFRLEPIRATTLGLHNKVKLLFPHQWQQVAEDEHN